jgi:hypothetical protein
MPEVKFGQMCIANSFEYTKDVPYVNCSKQLKDTLTGQKCVVLRDFGDGSCKVFFEHDTTRIWRTDALTPIDNNQNLQP